MARPTLRAALLMAALCAAPATALGEGHFLFPEIGLSGGRALLSDGGRALGQLDLNFGAEWDSGGLSATGWLFDLKYAGASQGALQTPWSRLQLGPLITWSLGYGGLSPFARVGVGPQLSWTFVEPGRAYLGAGILGEVAVGFKDMIELFAESTLSIDGHSPSAAITGGLRFNALIFLEVVSLVGYGHHHSYWRPSPHPAAPVAPYHPATPVN